MTPSSSGPKSLRLQFGARFVMLLSATGTVLLILFGLRLSESLSDKVHQARIQVAHDFQYLQQQAHTLSRMLAQSSPVQRGTHFRHIGLLKDHLAPSARELNVDLIVVHDVRGRVLFHSGHDAGRKSPTASESSLQESLSGQSFSKIERYGKLLRLISMNPIYHPTEKKRLTGVLTLGYDLDDDFFHSLQAMTGTPVLLVSQTRVIASSFETDSPTEFGPGPQHQTIGPFTYDLSPIPIRQDLGESLDLVVAVNTEQTRSTLYWVMLVTPILFFLFWRERTTSEFRQTKNMQGAVEEVQAQVSDAEQAANASKRARVSAQAQLASTQQFLIRAQRLSIIGEQLSSVSQDIYGSLQSILKVQKEQRTQTSKSLQTLNRLGLGGDDARDLEGSLRDLENGIYENQLMGRRIWDLVSAIMSQSATERTATNGIHLEPLITQALTIFRGRTKLHKITTDYLDPPLFGGKAADIGLVITNLLDNAIDAVDERAQNELRYGRAFEGRIHVHASRAVRHEELGLRVVITDNGPGIAEDDIEKIFEPFFSNKPAGSCLGLGLTISQGIIEEHCGTLIASRDAALGGARFDMWIPDTWQGSSTG